jgi:DNA-binding HxlR family transcriptional regulator
MTATMPAWDPYARNCPTRRLLDRIGDRWTVLVIGALDAGPRRFGEIARRVDGVSQKMLTQTLRGLEQDGIVSRTIYPQIPPRVEYRLTPLGETLREPLKALENWATTHMNQVIDARERRATPQAAPAAQSALTEQPA